MRFRLVFITSFVLAGIMWVVISQRETATTDPVNTSSIGETSYVLDVDSINAIERHVYLALPAGDSAD